MLARFCTLRRPWRERSALAHCGRVLRVWMPSASTGFTLLASTAATTDAAGHDEVDADAADRSEVGEPGQAAGHGSRARRRSAPWAEGLACLGRPLAMAAGRPGTHAPTRSGLVMPAIGGEVAGGWSAMLTAGPGT
ncbi:hypothetical protein BS78_01G494500 [Paspalum vaginatum]|nr:hypothetical protein BS78_01G494500 [Paspalum vaginatum]